MSATGLEVFDRTIQTTNTWLAEITEAMGCSRQVAWHGLGAVLHALRDRVPLELAAHLGAQLPLLVRGQFYDQWHPASQPEHGRTLSAFTARVADSMSSLPPLDTVALVRTVFHLLAHRVDPGMIGKVVDALPEEVRLLWREGAAVAGRTAERDEA